MKKLWKYFKGLPLRFGVILAIRLIGLIFNLVLSILTKEFAYLVNVGLWGFLVFFWFFKCCPNPTNKVKLTETEENVVRYLAKNENATYKDCGKELNMSESLVSNTLRRARDRNKFCKSSDLINAYRRNHLE